MGFRQTTSHPKVIPQSTRLATADLQGSYTKSSLQSLERTMGVDCDGILDHTECVCSGSDTQPTEITQHDDMTLLDREPKYSSENNRSHLGLEDEDIRTRSVKDGVGPILSGRAPTPEPGSRSVADASVQIAESTF